MFSRLIPDKFILWLLASVALASLLPVQGVASRILDWATLAAIFSLFFLHGVRLPREALLSGFTDWRLHLAILASTFVLFPAIGVGLSTFFPQLLSPQIWTGILFLCALPSTVQSSIAFTSMSGGNVAGAVAAAAFSNLLGVFLTPLLVSLVLQAQGGEMSFSGIGKIASLLFLPFVLGHALRRWLLPLVAQRPRLTTIIDKGTILLAVYGAFSAAMVEGLWSRVPPAHVALVAFICLALLGLVLAGAHGIGRLGGFSLSNRRAILFCGSVKSLASGVAMARVLFPGSAAGLVILPIMLFHTLQLIVCAWIAAHLGRRDSPGGAAPLGKNAAPKLP